MSCRTGPRCLVSYKRMEEKDVVPDRSFLINLSKGQFGLRTRSLCFMMIAAKQQEYRLFKRYLSKRYGAVSDSVLGPWS